MSTVTVTVHLGIVPINALDWQHEPLNLRRADTVTIAYSGQSFVSWSEWLRPDDVGDPHLVELDLDAHAEPGHENCTGATCLSRETLEEISEEAREAVYDLVPEGWRLVDYVVITDAEDYAEGARTVGRWGA